MSLIAVLSFVAAACGGGNVFDLAVGTCFNDGDLSEVEITDVPVVDCAEPHDNEVYYLFDMADGLFPGVDQVSATAFEGCVAAFDSYVGLDYASSELVATFLAPSSGSWEEDDREVVCFLYQIDLDKLTGTMRDSGI
ncbi:MAG TPA: hypothetical protein ENH15_05405 [Actinobacteria bacterium]|nr:hypothetical protein [Actinomycetota bacterium]